LFSTTKRGREDTEPEMSTAVVEAVQRLPERQRLTVLLKYYLDLSEAEIAETLGTAVGTVKSQLAKARHNMQRSLTVVADD
jgi:RNA polymerase sigma factor (sigma-70 family)